MTLTKKNQPNKKTSHIFIQEVFLHDIFTSSQFSIMLSIIHTFFAIFFSVKIHKYLKYSYCFNAALKISLRKRLRNIILPTRRLSQTKSLSLKYPKYEKLF